MSMGVALGEAEEDEEGRVEEICFEVDYGLLVVGANHIVRREGDKYETVKKKKKREHTHPRTDIA